ncbi:MAG: M20/M25/M40 family metallo-hydrolase [Gemmataceae bacterium]|jgi:acetylornithine deacetylase/succinyl-diaminopimelate desuccinylase-like protein
MFETELKNAEAWIDNNHASLVSDLRDLVKIPSISTDGEHQKEIELSAEAVCQQMKKAGLNNVEILRTGDSNPFAYGEWLGAPNQPTLFLYSHHDVQPINYEHLWLSPPWELTAREGRLFGRGAADDKGASVAQLASIASWLKTAGKLPVNIKMLVEGEEEVGSKNLVKFFSENRSRIQADIIVVCDTENIRVGLPSITYSLRGIVTLLVEVKSALIPVHSGMAGGAFADSALALTKVLSRLCWEDGPIPIQGFYDSVKPLTDSERTVIESLPVDSDALRKSLGVPDHVKFALQKGKSIYEQTWRHPAVTVIAIEASNIKGASNQVLPTASALVSCRIVPDQDPKHVEELLRKALSADAPWGVEVKVTAHGSSVDWWMTDPTGPAFEAAIAALEKGFKAKPVGIGCGGTIGFVRPLVELLGGAPALLLGIEDPDSNAHAPNESLHEGDWIKLIKSMAHLFGEIASRSAK